MTEVFRKNDRHPEDPCILIIKDFEDFKLWDQRKELGFKGLLLPHAFSAEECDFISKDILSATKQKDVLSGQTSYDEIVEPIGNYTPTTLYERSDLAPLTIEKVSQCADLFKLLAEKSRYSVDNLHVRTNSIHPETPHAHGVTLSTIFSGKGTQLIKPDFEFTAQELKDKNSDRMPEDKHLYSIDAGDLIMFEDIWHMAGKLSDNKDAPPRTQLLI